MGAMEVTWALVALAVVLLLGQYLKLQWAARKLPPGPTPLPILGNLWALRFSLHHETLMQLAKIYGNTMTLWAGHTPLVITNGYEAVRDMLVSKSEETSGRPQTPYLLKYAQQRGVIASTGDTWKQQRRASLTMMRKLGIGQKRKDNQIQEEAQHMIDFLTSQEGRPLNPEHLIMSCVTNVISAAVFGHRFSFGDDVLHNLMEATKSVSPFLRSFWGMLYETFPWLISLLPGPHQKVFDLLEYARNYVKKEVKDHQASPKEEHRDFIDLYINTIEKAKHNPNIACDESNLVQDVMDLFFAGSETTALTLLWALLYMLKYPDIQEKVQRELDDVLEPSETIHYEHRMKLPYTNAVIHEALRYSSIVPLALPHHCVKDTTIQGFHLEKGTVVIYNLFSVHHDRNIWEAPEEFNPSRFLDKDGNFVKNEKFIPFSAGHRACLGEQMGRTELFIFFSSLLRHFTFHLPEGVKTVNLDFIMGTTLHPLPYQIRALPRWDLSHHSAEDPEQTVTCI
ncbi:cytochrome P450 2J2-like isoform X2 [Pleurodeles waltl]|uniref:cytochrome P450 2J2-like isoform X2 n=1 Tax=Pleurodeles waltl TaxID=8319 RepID=UPI00370993D1